MKEKTSISSIIFSLLILCMALFGIRCGDTNYRLRCSTENGVELIQKPIIKEKDVK